jgi:hypothetical protein
MKLIVEKEVAALERMTVKDLRVRYADAFGEATLANNKAWLVKRIAWRLQAIAEGDLSERARQRAAELANDANLRTTPPKLRVVQSAAKRVTTETVRFQVDRRLPPPGTIVTREYKGETLQVSVLPSGFEFQGEVFKSLSAVAKAITGQHCNGYHFFRLGREAHR